MRIDPLDFPQARFASEHVVRGLEFLDPTACIVHMDEARWMVGKVRPSAEARVQAEHMLTNWTRNLQAGTRMSDFGRRRVRFAMLAYLGFRPVQQYDLIGAPDSGIVRDFAISQYLWRHAREDEPLGRQDIEKQSKIAAARADIADIGRARDAWKYAFTRSHLVGGTLTPAQRVKSGWLRHPISST